MIFSGVLFTYGQTNENIEDTNSVMQLLRSANLYDFSNADSGLILSEKALDISRKLHFKKGEAEALH